jgi:TPR repeat protein
MTASSKLHGMSLPRPWLPLLCAVVVLAFTPGLAKAQGTGARECLALAAAPLDHSSQAAYDKNLKTWLETCQQALAAKPDDTHIKVALAHAVWLTQGRAAALVLLREAAAQNDTEAMLAIFNDFNSFDRNLNRPDLIPRAEAQQALYHAAELGNPDAIWRLTTILSRHGPLKHDLAAARMWGERALANPPKDMRRSDIQVGVG